VHAYDTNIRSSRDNYLSLLAHVHGGHKVSYLITWINQIATLNSSLLQAIYKDMHGGAEEVKDQMPYILVH
jgi:hypothetical protein